MGRKRAAALVRAPAKVASDITKYTGQYSSTMASDSIESAIFLFSFEIGHTPSVQQLL